MQQSTHTHTHKQQSRPAKFKGSGCKLTGELRGYLMLLYVRRRFFVEPGEEEIMERVTNCWQFAYRRCSTEHKDERGAQRGPVCRRLSRRGTLLFHPLNECQREKKDFSWGQCKSAFLPGGKHPDCFNRFVVAVGSNRTVSQGRQKDVVLDMMHN